jgi:hypothetical protein
MPKRRDDILQRARQIMAQYTDRQIIVDFFNDDDDQRLSVSALLVQIREQLRGEFGCSIDTARHHIALVIDERRKKYIVKGPDGYALDWNNKDKE